jgi:hypothetical protein
MKKIILNYLTINEKPMIFVMVVCQRQQPCYTREQKSVIMIVSLYKAEKSLRPFRVRKVKLLINTILN